MSGVIEHDFEPLSQRCRQCGTRQAHHEKFPQPCTPRWGDPEPLRPEPARRVSVLDGSDEMRARIIELAADRLAIMNASPTEETD